MATCCSLFHWCPNFRICFFLLHSWLFEGLGREKAEELLQLPNTKVGSFMIRESETRKGEKIQFFPSWSQALTVLQLFNSLPVLLHMDQSETRKCMWWEDKGTQCSMPVFTSHLRYKAVLETGLAMAMESSTGISTNKTQLFKHYYLLWSHAKLIRQWDLSNGGKVTALPWSTKDCLKKL